jgi:hypothetical protein
MAVTLNQRAFDHAKTLITEERIVFDERDSWSEHRPSAQQENEFVRLHGFAEYGKWYLGINDESPTIPRGTTNSLLGILKMSTAVACSLRKIARVNTSTMTSRTRQRICTE